MIDERYKNYDKPHCWQHDVRITTLQDDLMAFDLSQHELEKMRVSDFTFRNVADKGEQKSMKSFIERYEWLGNLSQYTTHWFGAYYKSNILAGVILFNLPNAFSKMLGDDTPNLERLISRGASISWAPKNLASSFLMWNIKWMVRNTDYRLFTAYSDPVAKELGTIYQACNFYYLGQKWGSSSRHKNPYTGKYVSDRYFRQKSAYKKYAADLGIQWGKDWNHKTGMSWDNMPDDIEKILRDYSKKMQSEADVIYFPKKHKYAYVLGTSKKETKHLKQVFKERNNICEYPKTR